MKEAIYSSAASEKSLSFDKVDFKEVNKNKEIINIIKKEEEKKKHNLIFMDSEKDKSSNEKINNLSHIKIEVKKENKIDAPTYREFISYNKKGNNENINTSNKSNNKNELIHNVFNHISSSIKKSFRQNNRNNPHRFKYSVKINEKCLICEGKLKNEEKVNNAIKCLHIFCDDCYYEFIKEKINSNYIEGIKCPYKDCGTKLYDSFIEEKLIRDIPLLDKYKLLQQKRQLMLNPNIQLCPFPDCDSYAIKAGKNNYVKCIKNGHEFCFNCLQEWHGEKKCDTSVDKSFEKWRNAFRVKRCPNCKFFIEKNEGCNHITCYNCKYEFCWLCMEKISSGHYEVGRCSGLQSVDCCICSIRIFNFLYQALLAFVKSLFFGLVLPFLCVIAFGYIITDSFTYKVRKSELINIISALSYVSVCLHFIILIIPITSFIAILMFLFWPLQEKIFSLLE